MKYEIVKSECEYTGGGVWVLFSEIWLPDKKEVLFATTDDVFCFFYHNRENYEWCTDPDEVVSFDYIDTDTSKYKELATELFERFENDKTKYTQ